jgi:hypothetical protein
MATEASSDARTRGSATPHERTAAELGSFVADKVRAAIESAEESAEDLRRSALEDAAADRAHIHRSAAVVVERIDAVEAQVRGLLDGLREEVTRIVEQADRALEERPVAAEQPPGSADSAAHGSGRRRRGRLFGRRRRALPQCAVCARSANDGDDDLDRWLRVSRLSLCPDCHADGWQIPEGASVPYRPQRGRAG